MRKILLAAAGFAALAGAAGLAMAQGSGAPAPGGRFDVFQSDANSNGVLTRAEFDAGRDAHFTRLDANSDGQLSREEMRAGRGDHHRGGRRGGGMHRLEGADTNNDGNITRDEFLAGPTQMFDRLDANHDGVISTAERPQRRERAEGEHRGDRHERVNRDANGDHLISREEFASMGGRLFDRLDANHDGSVTRAEADAARPHHRGRN